MLCKLHVYQAKSSVAHGDLLMLRAISTSKINFNSLIIKDGRLCEVFPVFSGHGKSFPGFHGFNIK